MDYLTQFKNQIKSPAVARFELKTNKLKYKFNKNDTLREECMKKIEICQSYLMENDDDYKNRK